MLTASTRPASATPHAGVPQVAPSPAASTDANSSTPPERSGFTSALTMTAVVGGVVKGLALDRTRILAAYPHARSHGKTAKWAAELLSGRITNDVVPISGGTLRVAGRTLTTKAWQHSYQFSNAIGLGLLGVSMLYGFPNLIEGWRDGGGISGLMETRHGRTGVFATAGNLFQLGLMSTAFAQAPSGAGRMAATLRSPLLSSGPMILAGIAIGIPVGLNELGFFDFLDTGSSRSPAENAAYTVDRHLDTLRGVVGLA